MCVEQQLHFSLTVQPSKAPIGPPMCPTISAVFFMQEWMNTNKKGRVASPPMPPACENKLALLDLRLLQFLAQQAECDEGQSEQCQGSGFGGRGDGWRVSNHTRVIKAERRSVELFHREA